MKGWLGWLWWRLVVSALLLPLSFLFFIMGLNGFLFQFIAWGIGILCLVIGIAVWFYRSPENNWDMEGRPASGPRTEHETRTELERSKLQESNSISLSGYWVDRQYFGRFKGPKD